MWIRERICFRRWLVLGFHLFCVNYKGMIKQLWCCHTLCWIPFYTLWYEIYCIFRAVRKCWAKWDLVILRKVYTFFSSMLEPFWPILRSGRSYDWTYFAYLIHLWIALEQWLLQIHFCDKATESKNIDRSRICRESEQQLWCSIPSGWDILCKWRHTPDFASNTEIDYLNSQILRNENILWFQITMEKSHFVSAC